MGKAFTLLELIIIIVIITILVTIEANLYGTFIEKSRSAEAIQVLKHLRDLGVKYYLENQTIPSGSLSAYFGVGTNPGDIPSSCTGQSSHYFSYSVGGAPPTSCRFLASRCRVDGKYPPCNLQVCQTVTGIFIQLTTDFSTGQDTWRTKFY